MSSETENQGEGTAIAETVAEAVAAVVEEEEVVSSIITTTKTPGSSNNCNNPFSFTERLRVDAGEQWDRIIYHKFTIELSTNTIHHKVLLHYLIQDHRFLDVFVILLASMIRLTPNLQDRIPGCQFIALITSTENTYFERCFHYFATHQNDDESKKNDPEKELERYKQQPNDTCTDNFLNLMREVAMTGTYGEILAVLVVCEWTYLCWGQNVQDTMVRNDFITYEWIDLHSGPYFESVVTYLRTLLDNAYTTMNDTERELCKKRFLQTVQCEEDFFNNAYQI